MANFRSLILKNNLIMNSDLKKKYEQLKNYISGKEGVAVAYSGGVDSSLLLKVSHDILGEKALGIYCDSILQPVREKAEVLSLAEKFGVNLIILEGVDISHEAFRNNPKNRCYLCKGLIFDRIINEAEKQGIACVFDGSNLDDLKDYRPGKKALNERGVISPLLEAGITKKEVRLLSKELGMPTWDKDALACLATRIPYNEEVTAEKLRLIDQIESLLVKEGFRNVRARLRGDAISIEVREDLISILKERISQFNLEDLIANTGFVRIIVDREGYQQGKMNTIL